MIDIKKWLTLIVESVYPVDGGTLVVAAQHEEVLGVLEDNVIIMIIALVFLLTIITLVPTLIL